MRFRKLLALVATVGLAIPAAIAGGDHYKCTMSTQACLDEMVTSMKAHGWLGLELDKDEAKGTLAVKRVVPGSPAEGAGFKQGDGLVALNGIKFADENKDALMAAKKALAPGKQVTYTVQRAGTEKKITATLAEVPGEVLAQWIGNHMLEHATTAIAKN